MKIHTHSQIKTKYEILMEHLWKNIKNKPKTVHLFEPQQNSTFVNIYIHIYSTGS